MKPLTLRTGLTLAVLVSLGLGRPGAAQAQQPDKNTVEFKSTFTVKGSTFPMPLQPLLTWENQIQGEASLLGTFTGAAHAAIHLGVDGMPLFTNDGILSMVAPNGDALFQRWAIVFPAGTGAWIITGGRGRFVGATGSGTFTAVQDPAKPGEATITETGVISVPK